MLDQLERWYNLEFTLTDESYASNLVTVFIENKPIEDILDLISLANLWYICMVRREATKKAILLIS